jgi:hypothetical protein
VLIPRATLDAIVGGRVDLAFRRWAKPTVRTGGRLRTAAGELAVDDVRVVAEEDVSDGDAVRAGYTDRAELLASLRREGTLYRITLRYAGPDPRVARRERADLDAGELDAVVAALARLDRRGPWTAAVLGSIARWPGRRAPELAELAGRPTAAFKADVRKLKELGLTESLEVGYRLSPRGAAVLRAIGGQPTSST